MTIKQQLKARLDLGYGICHGEAFRITGRQSAGRRLRELAQSENLYYFNAEPKSKGDSPYRVFVKERESVAIMNTTKGARLFINDGVRVYKSKPFKSKELAFKSIKCTNKGGE